MIGNVLKWVVGGPITLLFVIFCLSNTQTVIISLWPSAYEIEAPLYLVILTGLFLGFILTHILLIFEPKRKDSVKHQPKKQNVPARS